MNTLPVFLLLASASAAPQLEGLANIFKALAGDDQAGETNGDYEQVPYTTLKTYNVRFKVASSFLAFLITICRDTRCGSTRA